LINSGKPHSPASCEVNAMNGSLEDRPTPKRLPARAWALFLITAMLVAISVGVRLAGYSLDRKSRILIDGPMLACVAISSLIIATYRQIHDQPITQENAR
jgi:hypothetical protein